MARGRIYRGNMSAGQLDAKFLSRTDATIRYQGVSRIWNMLVHPQGGVRTLKTPRSRPKITTLYNSAVELVATDRLYFDDSTIRTLEYYEFVATDGSREPITSDSGIRYWAFFKIRDEGSNVEHIILSPYRPVENAARRISAVAFSEVVWVFSPRFAPIQITVNSLGGAPLGFGALSTSDNTFGDTTGTHQFRTITNFRASRSLFSGTTTAIINRGLIYNDQEEIASIQTITLGGLLNENAYLIILLDGIPSGRIRLVNIPQSYMGTESKDDFTEEIKSRLLEIPAISQLGIDVAYKPDEEDDDDNEENNISNRGYNRAELTSVSDSINNFFDSSSASLSYPSSTPGLADKIINITFDTPGAVSLLQIEIIENRGAGWRVSIAETAKGINKNIIPRWAAVEQSNGESFLLEGGPSVASIFQNRMYVADENQNIGFIIASQIDIFSHFGNSSFTDGAIIINDNSAFTAEINSRGVPIINHYVVGRTLFVFTSLGIWAVNTQGAITPSTISVYKVSERVADKNIKPIEISGRIFFLEQGRPNLRMIEYNERIDNFEVRSVSQTFTEQLKGQGADATPSAMCLYREDEADYLAITFRGIETQSALLVLIQPEDELFAPSSVGLQNETINYAYCDEENQNLILTTPIREIILGGTQGEELVSIEKPDSDIPLAAWVELAPTAIQPEERLVISGLVVGIDDVVVHFTEATELWYGYRDEVGVGASFRNALEEYWQPLKDNKAGNPPYTGSVKLPKISSNEGSIRLIFGVNSPNATLYLSGVELEVSWN